MYFFHVPVREIGEFPTTTKTTKPSESEKFKKCRRCVTLTENKTLPILVFS